MLNYNEIKPKKYIEFEGEPYEVLSSNVFRKQQRKPVNQTKLKNLITSKVIEHSFHQQDKVSEAELDVKKIKYLYEKKRDPRQPADEFWFSEENNPSKRFSLSKSIVGDSIKFVKQNSLTDVLVFNEKIIGLKIPIKVQLKVKEAPPAVKGNTAQGVTKIVTLETEATVSTPIFINEGDIVEINTETGEYTGRI